MKSKRHIISILINLLTVIFLFLFLIGTYQLLPFLSVQLHKFIHVVAAIIFLGNIMIGPLWFYFLFKSEITEVRLKALSFLSLTDIIVTIPSYSIALLNGVVLASQWGGVKVYWIKHTLWDLLAFGILLIPIIIFQDKIYRKISQGADYKLSYKWWKVFGLLSAIPIIHVVFLMIFKPV